MKIIKSNTKQIFDTEDINNVNPFKNQYDGLIPLHQFRPDPGNDYDFLLKYFPKEHGIFSGFQESYFWVFENEINKTP